MRDLLAFTLPETTVALGAATCAAIALAAFFRIRSRPRPPSTALGWMLVAAIVGTYVATGHGLPRLLVGLALAGVAGLVADRLSTSVPVRALLLIPGAITVAFAPALANVLPTAVLGATAASAIVVGALLADVDARHAPRGLAPVLVAVTAVGIYETIPDPDLALVYLPITLPLALFAWPKPYGRLGGGPSAIVALLFSFAAAVGGRGRHSGFVGSLGTFGLVVLEPMTRFWVGRSPVDNLPDRPRSTFHASLAHLAIVLVASRVAGRFASTTTSIILVILTWTIGVVALVHVTRKQTA